jgi:pimeloyl-ACP methyl ester carboxylesterase
MTSAAPPPIRYATAADGARIAYATLGAGPRLLCLPPLPFCHLERLWDVPGQRRWYEGLAAGAELALYDARGCGLSDRRPEFALDDQLADLEAVRERLGWEEFALCAFFNSTPAAIAYAARDPARVRALVLWGGFARGADVYPLPLAEPAPALLAAQWGALVDSAARSWTAAGGEEARVTAAYFRDCVAPEAALRCMLAAREYDVASLAPRVAAPALVVHRRESPALRFAVARELATLLPRAELAVLAGDAASPFAGDVDGAIATVAAFLGLATPAPTAAPGAAEALTPREVEVLTLIARGRTNKEIAAALALSVHTVERHLTHIYPKIGCRGRTEAAAFALTHGYR